MKKLWHTIHLWLSIPFGIVFCITCLSGASLIFETEITTLVLGREAMEAYAAQAQQPQQQSAPAEQPKADEPRHGARPETAEAGHGHGRPEGIAERGEGRRPEGAEARRGEGNRPESVEQPTAKPQGQQAQQGRPRRPSLAFFRTMRQLHRWLLDAPEERGKLSVGKVIVGISTLLMVLVIVSGIVLWWPKSKEQLRQRMKIHTGQGAMRFWHDAHIVLGVCAVILILLMALTGLTWSFGWYRSAFNFIFGNPSHQLMYQLHTGNWGGLVSKILYFAAALIGAMLPLSGYYLWWKKRWGKGRKAQSDTTKSA